MHELPRCGGGPERESRKKPGVHSKSIEQNEMAVGEIFPFDSPAFSLNNKVSLSIPTCGNPAVISFQPWESPLSFLFREKCLRWRVFFFTLHSRLSQKDFCCLAQNKLTLGISGDHRACVAGEFLFYILLPFSLSKQLCKVNTVLGKKQARVSFERHFNIRSSNCKGFFFVFR